MFKIFKYDYIPGTKVELPIGAWVIRVDHVDDGFYKGDYVWAIVDVNQKETEEQGPFPIGFGMSKHKDYHGPVNKKEIKVKEKQEIICPGDLVGAAEEDGKLFVYHSLFPQEEKAHNIAVFKTGQEIDIPLDRMKYLGLNRLWIVMELGLYTFTYAK